jgi:hypothetical protein
LKIVAVALALGLAAVPARAELSSSPKVAATQAALRDLWLGHVFWVRNVANATMSKDAAAAKVAEEQVVANAKQIAGAIEPFYGKPASDKLFTLLAGHWGAVKEHIEATAKGDAKAKDAALAKAIANGDEIATFLSGANPNLSKDALKGLLAMHVGHHAAQNQQLKDKKLADEAKTWDAMRVHMYAIADALGAAIAKQFPEKF